VVGEDTLDQGDTGSIAVFIAGSTES
jgi:hypothetical protein